MRSLVRAPLFWILVTALALRLAGPFWGLPASDGWDDDGFAPRNFLTALALTYKPGSYFTYPPLQAFLLAVLTLPGWLLALLHAPSFAPADLIREFTKPPTMTFFAVAGRLAGIAMSLGVIVCIGQMARLAAGPRAGLFAAAAAALNVGLTYYGQVSNLDAPYLFWSLLSLLWCMRAIAGHEVSRWRGAALFAAAAVATKDQAYALFALSLPMVLLLWFRTDARARAQARPLARRLLIWGAVALCALLLVDGALTNPSGFAARLAFLTGPASGNYAIYQPSLAGRWSLLADMWAYGAQGFGGAALLLAGAGVLVQLSRPRADPAVWAAALLPLFAIVSFTVCFNFAALRTDARFLLPQSVLAAVYIGIAAERLAFAPDPWLRLAGRALLAVTAAAALYYCMGVGAAMLRDPRHDAEAWLRGHVGPGDRIETYGQNAYLPRFSGGMIVTRVGPTPLTARNPLPGVTEVRQAYDAVAGRGPRYIVVSAWWMQHYLMPIRTPGADGRMPSRNQQAQFREQAARRYFAQLQAGQGDYRLVHESGPARSFWPELHIHESLNETIRIFADRTADGR